MAAAITSTFKSTAMAAFCLSHSADCAVDQFRSKRIVALMMTFSRTMGGYSATSLKDFEGWQVISSLPIEGKGRLYCVRIARGKERRAIYVPEAIGLTLQRQVREDALRLLLHKPKEPEPPQPESY
jgi:hypothetical protein